MIKHHSGPFELRHTVNIMLALQFNRYASIDYQLISLCLYILNHKIEIIVSIMRIVGNKENTEQKTFNTMPGKW